MSKCKIEIALKNFLAVIETVLFFHSHVPSSSFLIKTGHKSVELLLIMSLGSTKRHN